MTRMTCPDCEEAVADVIADVFAAGLSWTLPFRFAEIEFEHLGGAHDVAEQVSR